jgi:2-polyprenyl-3-methyl-5-hydroxy-6-metoxy-1,4-benzoquinol methylase
MSIIKRFLNPIIWIKAKRYHNKTLKFDKSLFDLELALYSKILKNDMLHYGHFKDTKIEAESISLKQLEEAQVVYANNIIQQVSNYTDLILDVGCGMGGLAGLMQSKGYKVEVLTPNKNQIDYIGMKMPEIKKYHCKFEELEPTQKYGTIINSESLQYIKLEDAIKKVEDLILPEGRWIIVDYFRIKDDGINKSGHLLEDFKQKTSNAGWEIKYEKDITLNVLPTLKFANVYVERLFLPLVHFIFEKLRYKKAWLYYMLSPQKEKIQKKIDKERASIDVEKFIREKKYMFFVLEK